MTTDLRELARLRTFYVGQPGSDDPRAAFLIDGRDYTDPRQVRADCDAAMDELAWRGLPAEYVTDHIRPDDPRPELPAWQTWNTRTVADWPLILDTDVGGDPDDAVALVAAARTVSALALVTTTDEHRGHRARLARHLLDLAGRPDVPVVTGPDRQSRYFCVAGLIPDTVPAQPAGIPQAVAAVCAATEGPVRWIGLGPLTNLATVLTAHPHLAGRLMVTQMGGAFNYRHPDRAEHNIRLDPPAAHTALALANRPRLVTSDITFTPQIEVTADSDFYHALTHSHTDCARLLRAHLDRWYAQAHPGSMQHDGLTLAAGLHLPFCGFAGCRITLDPAGRMREDPTGTPVRTATAPDYPAFMAWLAHSIGQRNETPPVSRKRQDDRTGDPRALVENP